MSHMLSAHTTYVSSLNTRVGFLDSMLLHLYVLRRRLVNLPFKLQLVGDSDCLLHSDAAAIEAPLGHERARRHF